MSLQDRPSLRYPLVKEFYEVIFEDYKESIAFDEVVDKTIQDMLDNDPETLANLESAIKNFPGWKDDQATINNLKKLIKL